MDELLKTYAKKRRDEAGAPMAMHPATRRLLQAEVAKLKPAPSAEPKSWLTSLWMFWPRIAFAAAMVAIGGVAVMSLFPPTSGTKEEVFFAKQDRDAKVAEDSENQNDFAITRRSLAPAGAPPAKPVDRPAVTLSDELKTEETLRRENAPLPALSIASAGDVVAAEKREKGTALADRAKMPAPAPAPSDPTRLSVAVTGPVPPAAPAAPAEPVALGNSLLESKDKQMAGGLGGLATTTSPSGLSQNDGAIVSDAKQVDALAVTKNRAADVGPTALAENTVGFTSQNSLELKQQVNNATVRSRFTQTQATPSTRPVMAKALSNPEAAVLNTFFVEQIGEQVRVVDGDGSIYEGKVVTGDAAAAKELEDLTGARIAGRQYDSRLDRTLAEQDVQQQRAQTTFNYQLANGQTPSVWNFRATGTNRTLKQPVTIDALVYETAMPVVVTNLAGKPGATVAGQEPNFYRNAPGQVPGQQSRYPVNAASSQATGGVALQNSGYLNSQSLNLNNALRIQGSYRIGPTNQRSLDAVPDRNQP